MSGIFAADSALMRILTRIADLMILNLVFIATAIPIVTLGAALTALNYTAMRIARSQCDSVTGDFFTSFRRNFRQATLLGLILLLIAGVLGAWFVVVSNLAFGPMVELILLAVWYLVAFVFALNVLFVFPYLANFEGTIREVLRNARLMSWRHPLASLTAFAVIALSVIVSVFYPQLSGYGLLWLAMGFSGIAWLTGILFARVFDQYAPQPTSDALSDEV